MTGQTPGPGRITLALLAAVPAAMACPWPDDPARWLLGLASAAVVILFARRRGQYLTTVLGRRLGLLLRRGDSTGTHESTARERTDVRTTVVLRLVPGTGSEVPLDMLAGYLDRYGLTCESVRVTSRQAASTRTTWISLTMSARANLVALQARSTRLPLQDTAGTTLRRVADQLREDGWQPTLSEVDVPDLLGPSAREQWRAVSDGSAGYVAAYGIDPRSLGEVLSALRHREAAESWTALELRRDGIAAACAIRTHEMPAAVPPLPGLLPRNGRQARALAALVPTSTHPLDAEPDPSVRPSDIRWHAGIAAAAT